MAAFTAVTLRYMYSVYVINGVSVNLLVVFLIVSASFLSDDSETAGSCIIFSLCTELLDDYLYIGY